ncbi:hypothetical protein PHAVU_008G046701 [Phaseolus vulgaris]
MKDDYIPHISVRKPFRRSPFINLRAFLGNLVLLITTKLGFLPHEKRGYNSNDTYIYLYYISLAVAVTVNTVQASRWHVPAHWYVVWEKDFLINL